MSDKKGFPTTPQAAAPTAGFVPAPPPHPAVAAAAAATAYANQSFTGGGGGTPYAMYQQLYPGQAPPSYDQQAIMAAAAAAHQMYPVGGATAAAMYNQAAAAGYYPSAFTPVQAYYPLYSYPQPQMRPTIMIPNGYEAGARFDGIAAPVLPGPPPGVPPTPAQLAAMAGHNIALTQKKGTFLTGATEAAYPFW